MAEKAKQFRQMEAKVLIVSEENVEARRLVRMFSDHGLSSIHVTSLDEGRKSLARWKPQVVLCNLLVGRGNAYELLDFANKHASGTSMIVLSSHKSAGNAEEAVKHGASDYIERPFVYDELLNRVILHCRKPIELDNDSWSDPEELGINSLLTSAMSEEPIEKVAHEMTQLLAKSTKSVRCSVIRVITANEGMVFASHDDAQIAGLRIDLGNYPEVQLVANTKKMIAINDLSQSRALKHIKDDVKSINFSAMVVAPIFYRGRFFGVVSVRFPKSMQTASKQAIRVTSITSKVMSLFLSSRNPEELGRFGLISAS